MARRAEAHCTEGLAAEVETLRDSVIRLLMEDRSLAAAQLLGEMHRIAGTSSKPRFWRTASERLRAGPQELLERDLDLDEVAEHLLELLGEAIAWQISDGAGNDLATPRFVKAKAGVIEEPTSSISAIFNSAAAWAWSVDDSQERGLPVRLNVYDVSRQDGISRLNSFLAHEKSPVKLGGVFHTGVEVNGLEWSFGYSVSIFRPGVTCIAPRTNKQHRFRESLDCGRTPRTAEEIGVIISQLLEEFPGHDYDLLHRNCCHFAHEFCERLAVRGVPGWLSRLANLGIGVEHMVKIGQSVKEQLCFAASPAAAVAAAAASCGTCGHSPPSPRRRNRRGSRQRTARMTSGVTAAAPRNVSVPMGEAGPVGDDVYDKAFDLWGSPGDNGL
eukprot:TRINITY_DN51171_c0_g1_i1.p1 TRINITY_DN51171_c0_g1~~TRINITY_DN51171_c0_g1_i1.p1  ORF type:complete len:428 (+),score=83.32 TRINITY_DN51171_c0_g1_i1:128-1285(+)